MMLHLSEDIKTPYLHVINDHQHHHLFKSKYNACLVYLSFTAAHITRAAKSLLIIKQRVLLEKVINNRLLKYNPLHHTQTTKQLLNAMHLFNQPIIQLFIHSFSNKSTTTTTISFPRSPQPHHPHSSHHSCSSCQHSC